MSHSNLDISEVKFERVRFSYIHFLSQIKEVSDLLTYAGKINTGNFRVVWSITSRSAIMISSGFLERYLRDSFMEFIEQINCLNIDKKYLKRNILITNKNKTIELLDLINRDRFIADYEKIITTYSTLFDNNLCKPILVKETFSLKDSNPGEKTIREMFNRIGIKDVFKHEYFKELNYVDGVDGKIKGFTTLRNSFAHGALGITIPSLSDTQQEIEFLKTFVYILNKILEDEILNMEKQFHRDYFKTFPHVYN
ncbi:hypothetical protein EO98_09105 [Methanosarcina sp. 2.H.T.1A.6]|uniref:HEPN domain-containing protein n=1 Tax=unclassified Methanosarcina TaxID=2644672 RepID=UPI0006217BEA|nr:MULTISPECIES: HEPN domain-containing protein [unclassified Methanosarcina]KKG14125.1 hypothetical protein EO94_15495 [Methanosarcina sp. 2.H.T.1A.3]KKG15381.1 hypothetical protein EO97_17870 [Methanosarcina sp. 2.H.T.1A.15]KKG19615.1 hypothetical protein EO98_09105 [Methanosarcina sp. 2.H.T.1A.6]KKG26767.1 hypothetical protein EO96_02370 [Methanosarcina sp. 2.H.T.1A.8]